MKSVVPLGFLALATGLAAAEETRGLGAHEHGVGLFNIALEGTEVAMELEAPGADIVGFEHAAESAEDRAAVAAAKKRLGEPLSLFVLPEGAGCELVSADVALIGDDQGLEADDDHGHDEHAHEEHGHDEHAHDDHGHDEHGHDEHGDGHTEFHAAYRLSCAAPAMITRLEFGYFDAFPNARELEVQIIGPDGSAGFEATRDVPSVELPGSS